MNFDPAPHDPMAATRASIARTLADYYQELRRADARQSAGRRFSLSRVLQELNTGHGLNDGWEKEVCAGLAHVIGDRYDRDRPMIPWAALDVRDLTAAAAAAGGYMVGTEVRTAVDVLRGWSVAVDAGITIADGLIGNQTIPTVTNSATAGAVSTEGTAATESTPTFGQAAMMPKNIIGYVEFSRQLSLQVPSLETLLRAHLLRVVGELLDKQILYGSGAAGEITGLLNTSGVSTQSGSALSWAGIRAMRKASVNAGALESGLAWIGAADTQETLSGRERFTGAGAIWADNGIGGRPAYATKVASAGSLVVGPWSSLVLGLWGGVQVEYNPYAAFQSGIKGARVIVSADMAVTNRAAFVVATSVT